MMYYRVLGQLSIGDPELDSIGDPELELPTGLALRVLAVLLINANRRVSQADLRQVWDGDEPEQVQVQKRISEIRKFLARAGREKDLKTHVNYGYELQTPVREHDLLLFQHLVQEAGRPGADEDALLAEGLRLWRGPWPLAGVSGDSIKSLGADAVRRRRRALIRLAEIRFAAKEHATVLDDLRAAAEAYPTEHRLCELLMLALYHCGYPAEAAAAYARHAEALETEYAQFPRPELKSLKNAILRDDRDAIGTFAPPASPAAARRIIPRELPPALPAFTGRDDLVAEATWLLSREQRTAPPVLVVTGPGGIGKTTLVTHVAHAVTDAYPDGQLFVDLRGTTPEPASAEELLGRVLRALGVADPPHGVEERTARYRSLLAGRRTLIVLDDARDEQQLRNLIPGDAGCGVLIATRTRLPGLSGAHHLPTLQPLPSEHGNALFTHLIRDAGIDPAEEAAQNRRIVELCAGLPLAIRIAAALRGQFESDTARGLADRLAARRSSALVYGDQSVPRSIAAGLDQLDDGARRLFFGLGGLELPTIADWTAAALLDGTGHDPYAALHSLARAGLLQHTGNGRFRFHDLTRDYAATHQGPHGGTDTARVYAALLTLTRQAHRTIYAGNFEVVHSDVPDIPIAEAAEVERPLEWFDTERTGIRAAVRHAARLGLSGIAWDLAVTAHEFYTLGHWFDDWQDTHQAALTACTEQTDPRGRAALLTSLGQPAYVASGRPGASGIDELAHAIRLFAEAGDGHGEALAHRALANAFRRQGRHPEASAQLEKALPLFRACGDTVGLWLTLRYMGQNHLDEGDATRALDLLTEAAHAADALGHTRMISQSALWLGRCHLALDRPAAARVQFERVIATVPDAEVLGRAYAYHGLGDVALRGHNTGPALEFLQSARDLARQASDGLLEGRIELSLAHAHRATGDLASARAAAESAAALFTQAGATAKAREAEAFIARL